ncbi:hypothetical protein NKI59_26880 [Mesorhizobium sp. M0598]|uniref:hypothetical protein n=1 Tax=Mesorhizobium sp. M0598 TaxID=2956968 RepID=UPI0033361ACD
MAEEGWTGVFALNPGDVIYLTTSIKGFPLGSSGSLQNPYPLWSDAVRLPLRKARGPLTSDEANLLMGFLAAGAASATLNPEVPAYLESSRTELWNALADTFVLSKATTTQPAQLQVRMGDQKGENNVVDEGFCTKFRRIAGHSVLATSFFVTTCGDASQTKDNQELRRIEALSGPLSAVTETSGNLKSDQYYDGTVAVSVARVERAGVAMLNRSGQEARWSLADWQKAGICVDAQGRALRIVHVTLRDEPLRLLRVMPAHKKGRFDIKPLPLGTRTTETDRTAPAETLSEQSLVFLSPGDVRTVRWGYVAQFHPPNTAVALSSAARKACNP